MQRGEHRSCINTASGQTRSPFSGVMSYIRTRCPGHVILENVDWQSAHWATHPRSMMSKQPSETFATTLLGQRWTAATLECLIDGGACGWWHVLNGVEQPLETSAR